MNLAVVLINLAAKNNELGSYAPINMAAKNNELGS
jgi:hypothetical protein